MASVINQIAKIAEIVDRFFIDNSFVGQDHKGWCGEPERLSDQVYGPKAR